MTFKREPSVSIAAARSAAVALALLVSAVLGGCASVNGAGANPNDPFESFNRGVFGFNDQVDRAVIKPVAIAYQDAMPEPVRKGVSNFFGNLSDVWSFVNNVLQLKGAAAAETAMRVGVNTTFGLGGLIDIASLAGIPRNREDFGQTLGYWGVPSGPYLVLPLWGPSTVRDTAALTVDAKGDLGNQIDPVATRNTLTVLEIIDLRASLLGAGQVLEEAALDRYGFARDVYLQRRTNDVYDGDPPADQALKTSP